MAGEWRSSNWGEEISLEYGKALRDYKADRGNYRVYGSNGPIGWHDKALTNGPGVVLGRKGAYRGVEYSPVPFYVIDTAYYVVPKNQMDMRWLYYAIKHHKLGEIDDGSPIPSTTRAAVYIRELEVPSLVEQRAIAHILGTLDDKIELNRKMNETLEEMARAVFKSWFVDFDPVIDNALRAGKPIPPEFQERAERRKAALTKSAKVPTIGRLFPDEFQSLENGWVPKGWRIERSGDLFEVCIGKTPPRKEHKWFSLNPIDFPWISIRDLGQADVFISSVSEYLTPDAVEKFRIRKIPSGVVVLSFKLTVGRVAITDGEMLSNEAIAHFLPNKDNNLSAIFVYLYLCQFDYHSLGSTSSIATAVNSDSVRSIPILVPSDQCHRSFQTAFWPTFEKIKFNERESRTLSSIRDALLPKLLSGEIRLKDAEKFLSEAV